MIIPSPVKEDFDFRGDISVDNMNEGFTQSEMKKFAGPVYAEPGAMGVREVWKNIWRKNREIPPEIQDLKSEFGYHKKPFITNLVALAESKNIPLDGHLKVLSEKNNFFIMQCGVFILPNEGEKFEVLKFDVHYKNDNIATYTMLPGPQVKKILELGGKAAVGINGEADFGFPDIPFGRLPVGGSVNAELDAKFIIYFDYELKTQKVDSSGIGNSFCKWIMYKGNELRNDVIFYPVIMMPKTITRFECEFEAHFKINHRNWKNPELFKKPPIDITVSI